MANLLPLRSLIYALSYTKYKVGMVDHIGAYARRLAPQVRILNSVAKSLGTANEINPDSLYRSIEGSVTPYVEMFYALEKEKREAYLNSLDGYAKPKHIRPEQNLLLVPALMAERGIPKEEVVSGLSRALYKAPFKALYDSSKAALHIALLEESMAIKKVPDRMLKDFSGSLTMLKSVIERIEEGEIEPHEDEKVKRRFISEAVAFSEASDVWVADFICERLNTRKVNLARVHMMARRAQS